jgi:hypothetical protein
MKRFLPALAATVALGSASPAFAFDLGLGLFKKKPAGPSATPAKADTSTKVKQLVATLQSDTDIDRRKAAAEELRSHDPRNNPDLIPALITAVQKDPSPAVRTLAAETIGLYKSLYPAAAAALDSAEKNDPDVGVRTAAKNALWQYHLNGFKSPAVVASTTGQTSEPPLATPRPAPVIVAVKPPAPVATATDFRPITQGMGKPQTFQPTAEPPLAKPKGQISAPPPAVVPDSQPNRVEPPTLSLPMPTIPEVPSGSPVPTITPPPMVK